MTNTASSGFDALLATELAPVIEKYALRVKPHDASEAFLIGKGYVLDFAADREGVELTYIARDQKKQLMSYTLRPLIMQRFKPEDRAAYGNPQTIHEQWIASLRVFAVGLQLRCADVLSGERSWLRADQWLLGPPTVKVRQALEIELDATG